MKTISKSEMLSKIVESGEVPFRIKFVRATKKRAGEIWIGTCYYGAPKARAISKVEPTQTTRTRKSHLESNTLPMTEFGSGKMLTPFISHIIEFNGQQVIH